MRLLVFFISLAIIAAIIFTSGLTRILVILGLLFVLLIAYKVREIMEDGKSESPKISKYSSNNTSKYTSTSSSKNTSTSKNSNTEGELMSEDEIRALLDRYDRKEIDDATLLKELSKYELFYTTPVGDTQEGTQKLFLIPGPEPTAYMPLFLNEKDMKEYYDNAGRAAFLGLKGTLPNLIGTSLSENQKDDMNFKYGLIIDPIKYKITIDAPALQTVMGMIGG